MFSIYFGLTKDKGMYDSALPSSSPVDLQYYTKSVSEFLSKNSVPHTTLFDYDKALLQIHGRIHHMEPFSKHQVQEIRNAPLHDDTVEPEVADWNIFKEFSDTSPPLINTKNEALDLNALENQAIAQLKRTDIAKPNVKSSKYPVTQKKYVDAKLATLEKQYQTNKSHLSNSVQQFASGKAKNTAGVPLAQVIRGQLEKGIIYRHQLLSLRRK